jgi:hypothetical protein
LIVGVTELGESLEETAIREAKAIKPGTLVLSDSRSEINEISGKVLIQEINKELGVGRR